MCCLFQEDLLRNVPIIITRGPEMLLQQYVQRAEQHVIMMFESAWRRGGAWRGEHGSARSASRRQMDECTDYTYSSSIRPRHLTRLHATTYLATPRHLKPVRRRRTCAGLTLPDPGPALQSQRDYIAAFRAFHDGLRLIQDCSWNQLDRWTDGRMSKLGEMSRPTLRLPFPAEVWSGGPSGPFVNLR